MKTFKETDNLYELRAGDRLEMNDGTAHFAVEDAEFEGCIDCSLWIDGLPRKGKCRALSCLCNTNDFHFEKIEKDEKTT